MSDDQLELLPPQFSWMTNKNPMVRSVGYGPKGAKCKTCDHLRTQAGTANRYYKCRLRGMSRGPATDHRVGWDACKQYEEGIE